MPQSTDLVTDLPADFEVFGQAVATSMGDLLGGASGYILSKNSATDMDFTWIPNDQGDITGLTAGTGILVTSPTGPVPTVTFDIANYGGGSYAAGKNKIINGDFFINQRAFSSTTTTGTFGLDRWQLIAAGGTSTYSVQSFTPGAAPVSGYEGSTFARLVSTGQSAAGDRTLLSQKIEYVRTFAGQTVTASFWAKASTGTPSVAVNFAQNFGTSGSATVEVAGQKTAITSSWVRYSLTFAIPSISGKTIGTANDFLQCRFYTSAGSTYSTETNSLGIQSATIDIWGVQIEEGSIATDFQTATGSIGGELALALRYFCKSYDLANAPGSSTTTGLTYSAFNAGAATTGALSTMVYFTTPMRISPTITTYDIALTSGKITRTTYGGADQNGLTPTASFTNEKSVSIISASGNSHTGLVFQWTASAEL